VYLLFCFAAFPPDWDDWSDQDVDNKMATAYGLSDATGAECGEDRVRRRLEEEWCTGLLKVCQVVRVDRFPGGAYLVDDVWWFDWALMPSLGRSSSCSSVESVSISFLH